LRFILIRAIPILILIYQNQTKLFHILLNQEKQLLRPILGGVLNQANHMTVDTRTNIDI